MIYPIRCFTCGKVFTMNLWRKFEKAKSIEERNKVLDDFGLYRYCCRRMILSNVNVIDSILLY